MKELDIRDKLFFFERNFFTLDGLWMIEAENETNWETALKIDLIVWKKLLKIILNRLKKYLELEDNTLINLVQILTFRWKVEGWEFEITNFQNEEIEVSITRCPYKSAMDRNPERQDRIPLICNDMCKPFYRAIITDFNPEISVHRKEFMGLGDSRCNSVFRTENPMYQTKNQLPKAGIIPAINDSDTLFYFERHFRTLDGLWMIETEEEINFETALKLDIIVWQRLYSIIFRRVKKYLDLNDNGLTDLVSILSFVWNCEGLEHEILELNKEKAQINVTSCPYIDAMKRNPERSHRITSIWKDMCIPYLKPVISE